MMRIAVEIVMTLIIAGIILAAIAATSPDAPACDVTVRQSRGRAESGTAPVLEGVKRALVADPTWELKSGPGLRAFSTVYAGWITSQSFYRDGLHLGMFGDPLPSTEEFLDVVTSIFGSFDPRDLLAMLATWQAADVSAHPQFQGDWGKALGSITAKAVVMPCSHDLYFPPEDNEIEVSMMPNATLQVIPSIWGHGVAHPLFASDGIEFIEQQLQDLLSN